MSCGKWPRARSPTWCAWRRSWAFDGASRRAARGPQRRSGVPSLKIDCFDTLPRSLRGGVERTFESFVSRIRPITAMRDKRMMQASLRSACRCSRHQWISATQSAEEGATSMARHTETGEIAMERAAIAGTSLEVSRVALGTWAIGGWMWGGTDETESIATIRAAVGPRINIHQYAPAYAVRRSHGIVGQGINDGHLRTPVLIATKA